MASSDISLNDILAADSMAADMDRLIVFIPERTKQPIDSWLQENLPSQTSRFDGVGWLCVGSPNSCKELSEGDRSDPEGLQDSFEKLKKSGREISINTITELAKIHHVLDGKWLFHASTGLKIDHLWSLVARATATGNLGTSAKVSPCSPDIYHNKHVVCMYVSDYTDKDQVMELEAAIRSIGIKASLSFKPDAYTYLGIYRQNPYGLRPTIYQSNYHILEGRSRVSVPCQEQPPEDVADWRSSR